MKPKKMKKLLTDEQLSRALSELCGPGLGAGGMDHGTNPEGQNRMCILQAALNTTQAAFHEEDPDGYERLQCVFDNAATGGQFQRFWGGPDKLLRLVEKVEERINSDEEGD